LPHPIEEALLIQFTQVEEVPSLQIAKMEEALLQRRTCHIIMIPDAMDRIEEVSPDETYVRSHQKKRVQVLFPLGRVFLKFAMYHRSTWEGSNETVRVING
jgi:hypothetical protein